MPGDQGVVPWVDYPPPPLNPDQGENSLPDPDPDMERKGLVVPLNPDDFPQSTCSLPPTFDEKLTEKPRCQYDYSLKWGLGLKAKLGLKELLFPFWATWNTRGARAFRWRPGLFCSPTTLGRCAPANGRSSGTWTRMGLKRMNGNFHFTEGGF